MQVITIATKIPRRIKQIIASLYLRYFCNQMISLGVMVSFSFAVFAINALHKKEEENVQDNFKKKRARVSPSILPLVGPSVRPSVCHT